MTAEDDFWNNRFHWCALAAGFIAASEGRLDDERYLRDLVYGLFEDGAFRDRVRQRRADAVEPGMAGDVSA